MTALDQKAAGFLRYDRTIGLLVMTGRGFQYPTDMAIGKNGRLYVTNRTSGYGEGVQVTMCNLDSEYFGAFGSNGKGDGQFVLMSAIATDNKGQVYVSDEHTHRISVFDPEGVFLRAWGVHGDRPGELDGPSGMAFDAEYNLYVVDQRNHRVQAFIQDGDYLMAFGSEGSGEGQFNLPWGITISPKGEVYVADWRNDRIQRFTAGGEFLASYGSSGHGDGELYRPASVAVDDDGYMYVADWGNDRLQVLDAEGGFVMSTRGEATLSVWAEEFLSTNVEEAAARAKADLEPQLDYGDDTNEESSYVEKYFWGPTSVELDDDGRLYVTDCNRHRLQIYQRIDASPGLNA